MSTISTPIPIPSTHPSRQGDPSPSGENTDLSPEVRSTWRGKLQGLGTIALDRAAQAGAAEGARAGLDIFSRVLELLGSIDALVPEEHHHQEAPGLGNLVADFLVRLRQEADASPAREKVDEDLRLAANLLLRIVGTLVATASEEA